VRAAAADASRTVRPEAEIEKEEGARMADCKDEELEEALAILACGWRGRAGRGVGRGEQGGGGSARGAGGEGGERRERVLPS